MRLYRISGWMTTRLGRLEGLRGEPSLTGDGASCQLGLDQLTAPKKSPTSDVSRINRTNCGKNTAGTQKKSPAEGVGEC